MNTDEVARDVLEALGGRSNVLSNAVCMTRLRVTLSDLEAVDYETLGDVQGVLGTATRGRNGLEVVFGPRVIEGIYHSFISLTGISGGIQDLFPMTRQETNMSVQIRVKKKKPVEQSTEEEPLFLDDQEMSALEDLFGRREDEAEDQPEYRLIVINGPNLNMLGMPLSDNEDASDDYPTLLELCKQEAKEAGFARCDCYQSNHEGDLIDMIQDAYDVFDAIVINPGAFGTSVALRDALEAISVPAIEVHLHKLSRRDRVGTACAAYVSGEGAEGYRKAIRLAFEQL